MADETTNEPVVEQTNDDMSGLLDTEPKVEATEETPPAEPTTPEATPETPAPTVAKEPEKKPETTTEPAKPVATVTPAAQRVADLEAKIQGDDFDPYSKEGRAVLIEHSRACASAEAEPLRAQLHESTIWPQLSEEHGIPAKDLKAAWKDVTKDLAGRSQDVLDYAFEQKIAAIKAKAATPTLTPTPSTAVPVKQRVPIKPAAGAVSPSGASPHRPPAPSTDAGAEFDKAMSRDDLASFIV